jgi:FtsZ-binding cell division protein ZapB
MLGLSFASGPDRTDPTRPRARRAAGDPDGPERTMASIVINGETVHLRESTLKDFQRFAEITWQRLRPDATIRQSVGTILLDAILQGQKMDDSVVQTVLWALHDLGVSKLEYDLEKKSMNLTEVKDTEASRGGEGAMAVAACETGRAYVAALANAQQRVIQFNGQPFRVFPQNRETLQRVSKMIHANRLVNEDLVFTACRSVGAMLQQGKAQNDPEFLAAVEIVTSFGVADIVVDVQSKKLGIRQFKEANAMATALLQGAMPKQVQQVRERVHGWQERLQSGQLGGNASQPPARGAGQRLLVPPVIGSRRSTRRRG